MGSIGGEEDLKKNFMDREANQFHDIMRDARKFDKKKKKSNWVPKSSWQPMIDYWDNANFKKDSKHNKFDASNKHSLTLHIKGSILISEHKRWRVK